MLTASRRCDVPAVRKVGWRISPEPKPHAASKQASADRSSEGPLGRRKKVSGAELVQSGALPAAQAMKSAWMFILDRVTGKPVYGIEESKSEVSGNRARQPSRSP